MASKSDIDVAIDKVLTDFTILTLKTEQRTILDCLIDKKDCMAILPAGFGKSLPYQMLVSVRRELEKETYQTMLERVAVGEQDEETAFRKWFRHIGKLRSMFPKACLLALSATCTNSMRKSVMRELHMQEDSTTIISKSTNQQNIKFCVQKVDNTVDMSMCIVYGAPSSVIDLIQEVGRIGRNGDESVALLLFNRYHLQQMEANIKRIYKTKTCFRLSIMEDFLTKTELAMVHSGTHNCCDICEKECKCGQCKKVKIEQFFYDIDEDNEKTSSSSSDTELYYYGDDSEVPTVLFDEY
ncbi:unnamed protein product [Mytilus coruscus]|uniref:DNA 3'-5' helicase n=1 Tax=Mytilus coruscus TaxID=42192 RepID=A0A6J8DSC6_MYTCO|nr:unnamed protein product [Mytilus coruscus]